MIKVRSFVTEPVEPDPDTLITTSSTNRSATIEINKRKLIIVPPFSSFCSSNPGFSRMVPSSPVPDRWVLMSFISSHRLSGEIIETREVGYGGKASHR